MPVGNFLTFDYFALVIMAIINNLIPENAGKQKKQMSHYQQLGQKQNNAN